MASKQWWLLDWVSLYSFLPACFALERGFFEATSQVSVDGIPEELHQTERKGEMARWVMLEMLEVERPTVVVADLVHWVGRATGLAVFNLNHMALNEEVEG